MQFLYALVALFSLHSFVGVANAQFQLYREPNARRSSSTLSAAPASPVDLRQYHERRDILDVCAFIDASVLPPLLEANICLCLSALPLALKADVGLAALVDVFGLEAATALLTKLILGSPDKKQCNVPEHGHLLTVCSATNPCGFTCDPPYVADGDQCVCKAPYSSCNGKCGSYPQGCGSAAPYAGARRAVHRTRTRDTV
ncbi:hypothetical protein EUX98_g6000 [Antrodiella citrinella]|uniref:Chitin-binding type-1 domain-containing protein n=1 Tax=Antrodiella citrinella TaxID=2447956 RepID=A0A4S4MS88_9APHY|nr:hypothetical protein EUX98_g6000 [Antrodiella citrinella]